MVQLESTVQADVSANVARNDSNKIELRRWDGALGAEINGLDVRAGLDSDAVTFVKDALWRYQVLSFPGQDLAPEDIVEFARQFGQISRYAFGEPLRGHPDVFAVTKEVGTELNFGGVWHSDSPYLRIPPSMTILYGVDIPTRGGDTMFADMYKAYETLSTGMKQLLDGLLGVYSALYVHGPGTENLKLGDVKKIRNIALAAQNENSHPIVRTHPVTNRKALYVSRSHIEHFKDMSERESAPLLDFLETHSCHPLFSSRLRWTKGMLVVFDNRCVQHFALNDYPTERRELYRVIVSDNMEPC